MPLVIRLKLLGDPRGSDVLDPWPFGEDDEG